MVHCWQIDFVSCARGLETVMFSCTPVISQYVSFLACGQHKHAPVTILSCEKGKKKEKKIDGLRGMCGMWEACVLCLHPHSDLSKRQTLVLRLQAAATNRGSLLPSQVSCHLSGLKSKITFNCQKTCKGTSLISSPILLTSHKLQWWWMSAFDLYLYMYFIWFSAAGF